MTEAGACGSPGALLFPQLILLGVYANAVPCGKFHRAKAVALYRPSTQWLFSARPMLGEFSGVGLWYEVAAFRRFTGAVGHQAAAWAAPALAPGYTMDLQLFAVERNLTMLSIPVATGAFLLGRSSWNALIFGALWRLSAHRGGVALPCLRIAGLAAEADQHPDRRPGVSDLRQSRPTGELKARCGASRL